MRGKPRANNLIMGTFGAIQVWLEIGELKNLENGAAK
jgi:hypothetical protein